MALLGKSQGIYPAFAIILNKDFHPSLTRDFSWRRDSVPGIHWGILVLNRQ